MKDMGPFQRYDRWIVKKVSGKPADERAFLRCTYENGAGLLLELDGAAAGNFSLAGYTEGKYGILRQMLEPLGETAVTDPDRFFYGLHEKLDGISRYIRDNSLYPEYFELFSLLFRYRIGCLYENDGVGLQVLSFYMVIMIVIFGYLTPSRYDMSHLLCGCSTDGEPLYCDTYYPYVDEIRSLAILDCEKAGDSRPAVLDSFIQKYAGQYEGYAAFRTLDDLNDAEDQNEFQTEEILSVSPYINEYTYDMIPDTAHIFDLDTTPLERTDAEPPLREITDSLDARCRTLPANGIRYDLSYSPRVPEENRLQALFLKETCRGDRFTVLYKLRYGGNDLCGYYDIKDRFFYSQFMTDTNIPDFTHQLSSRIGCIVLYLYSAAVTPDGERRLRDFGEYFCAAVSAEGKDRYPISVTPRPLEGELRNTWEDRWEPPETAEEPCGDGEDGQKKRTLQGYIRKLAPGEAPSEENRARARELGFALAEDEVYEEPFL